MSEQIVRIENGGESLIFRSRDGALPVLAFWGPSGAAAGPDDAALSELPVPHGMLDAGEVFDVVPEVGRGFTGHPALIHHRPGLGGVSQLRLARVRAKDAEAQFELADPPAGLSVVQTWTVLPSGVVRVRTEVANTGDAPLELVWAAALAVPCPHRELMLFDGRWAGEFRTVRQRLETGLVAKENRTGRTSHHAPPFLFAGEDGFGEDNGEVVCVHLAWSGDSRLFAERLRDGRIQLQAGELLAPGEVVLQPGEHYTTPLAYAARSSTGLNGLSARLHACVRESVLGPRAKSPRPVTFNTWEAVYFDHDLPGLKQLAEAAAAVGVERFVLDDGWFGRRDDDRSSLGDWTVDLRKYPDGLGPLVERVRGLGMQCGLWVEPEMVNADSDLYRAHPDWVLGVPGREQPLGRQQYVLDLTRPEVRDHLFDQLSALLAAHPISYFKWDANRDLTHAVNSGRPAGARQVRALYALMERLRAAHPDVEIESCASGGGRADYGVLERTERIWTSDNNDPIDRQQIQRGFSLVFPPEVMGAHVGPRRAHITGRTTTLALRAITALFGHMGIEGDLRAFSERERDELAGWIALHKRFRGPLHGGRLHRLSVDDPGRIAFYVEREGEVLVSVAQLDSPPHPVPTPLRLPGLPGARLFRATLLNPPSDLRRTMMKRAPPLLLGEALTVSAGALAGTGLPLPILRPGEAALFHLAPL